MRELTEELKQQYQTYNQEELNKAFETACRNDYLELVRYLLTSPELKDHADIHVDYNYGFRLACTYDCFKVVIYLLSFNGEQCIDFQNRGYNLDWAIEKKYNNIIFSMMKNLKNNNPFEYFECLSKIEAYNKELYEQLKNIKIESLAINSQETVLYL